jgi:quercetin dioxygenase-like cupin family protein
MAGKPRAGGTPAETEGAHAEAQRALFGEEQGTERLTFYNAMDGGGPGRRIPRDRPSEGHESAGRGGASVNLNAWYKGRFRARPILNYGGPNPKSILQVEYAPDAYIPQHYHDVDQMIFVLHGSLFLGKREFKAGAGYFTPAGVRYSVKAGPGGVSLVEIRRCALGDFDTIWVEQNPAKWV